MIRAARRLGLLASACGRDVYLGQITPDASPDAASNGNPFTAGPYNVQFLDPAFTNCSNALAGHEADFSVVTRASANLVDGAVTLATPDAASLAVSGTPITTRFAQGVVTLQPTGTAQPWSATVDGSFGAGPDSTTCVATALAADPATAQSPSGIQGAVALLFSTVGDTGQCTIDFGALFTKGP